MSGSPAEVFTDAAAAIDYALTHEEAVRDRSDVSADPASPAGSGGAPGDESDSSARTASLSATPTGLAVFTYGCFSGASFAIPEARFEILEPKVVLSLSSAM